MCSRSLAWVFEGKTNPWRILQPGQRKHLFFSWAIVTLFRYLFSSCLMFLLMYWNVQIFLYNVTRHTHAWCGKWLHLPFVWQSAVMSYVPYQGTSSFTGKLCEMPTDEARPCALSSWVSFTPKSFKTAVKVWCLLKQICEIISQRCGWFCELKAAILGSNLLEVVTLLTFLVLSQ